MKHSATRDFWSFEDDLAYYRIVPGAHAIEVYSEDVFVRHFSTWQLGVGGVVVSKKPLELNFARNADESTCPVWSGIRKVIEALVIRELTVARHLTDSQKKYLGIRFRRLAECARNPGVWKWVKLLTDPWGQHLALSALADFRRFVYIPEPGSLACAAHGTDRTFVVTDALLDRFGVSTLDEWLTLLSEAGLLPAGYSVVESEALAVQLTALGVISQPRPLTAGPLPG
ncbi:MAG TPA: hypothetical protein VHV80_05770 [Steroidobacteraceae bacterium]|jgi:hypothetical protein|nr:hypothetical protein [Steroidobacteraceae bacterium]